MHASIPLDHSRCGSACVDATPPLPERACLHRRRSTTPGAECTHRRDLTTPGAGAGASAPLTWIGQQCYDPRRRSVSDFRENDVFGHSIRTIAGGAPRPGFLERRSPRWRGTSARSRARGEPDYGTQTGAREDPFLGRAALQRQHDGVRNLSSSGERFCGSAHGHSSGSRWNLRERR